MKSIAKFLVLALVAAFLGACSGDEIKANEAQVAANQQLIEQNQKMIAELQAQTPSYTPGVTPPPNSCDRGVADQATRNGGERMASGEYTKAIGYYSDALAACPNDGQTELNLARAYEAAGDRASAIDHYKAAAQSAGGAGLQAKESLARLGVN